MPLFHPKTLLDKAYEIGILIKGIDGVLELVGGALVLLLNPHTITNITNFLTQDALQENPHNIIATHVLKLGNHLAGGHNFFAAAFLLTHGLVKVVLVACLLLNKLWAYPWALGVLGLFLVYQAYLLVTKPTFGMAFLTVLDIVIIGLIYREWQQVRRGHAPGTSVAKA
ncbi:MAG TPA: DUF2127 domain-containing protein [Candidatus Dormibacteraeota bacterium]|nr:DUF2127 domain-containing protein [Candidatus Dormibacteraeota bacterium]